MTQQVGEGPTELGPEDLDRLARYLARECVPDWNGAVVTGAHRVTGGMSWETYFIDAEDRDHGENRDRFVVRRAPAGGPLAPYDIEREARLVRALSQNSKVPVPRVLGFTTEPDVLNRPFAVLEFVAGDAPDLRRIESWDQWNDPAARSELAAEMMSGLAAIQAFDWRQESLPGSLVDGGTLAERIHARIGRFMERLEREVYPTWAPQPAVRDAAEWLKEHVPPLNSDDLVVVHGDYRFGNLIWQGTKLVAILDWERATIGHPMQDLGFMCMRMARQRNPQLMGMVATLDELGTLYEKATGRVIDLPSVHYFSMLAQFVEAALVPIGLAYACDIDRPPYVVALTVYPQLNAAVRNLVQDIEDFESGRYVL